jgi:hypothetical protein
VAVAYLVSQAGAGGDAGIVEYLSVGSSRQVTAGGLSLGEIV